MSDKAMQRLKDEITMFEAGIEVLSQEENPVRKLNQTIVEAMLENNRRLLKACEEGAPIIASYYGFAPEVLVAMDLPWYSIAAAPVTTPAHVWQEQVKECDNLDVAMDLCTAIRLSIYNIVNDLFPIPTALIAGINPCDGIGMLHQILPAREKWRNVPTFAPDMPYTNDDRAMGYYAREIREMVAFIEENTGRKLDIDRLREIVNESNRQYQLWAEYNELRRAVPCPHGYEFGVQLWIMVTMLWPGDPRCTAWLEGLIAQTEQLVREGKGKVPEEKIRVFWYDLRTLTDWMDELGSWLEKEWGAVVIMDMIVYNPYTLVDTSTEETMFRDLAKRSLCDALMLRQEQGSSQNLVTDITRVVKDYKIDCVIWPAHMGHKAMAGMQGIGREVCRELGVPLLQLGIDIFDPRYASTDEVKEKISSFFTTMELDKKHARNT